MAEQHSRGDHDSSGVAAAARKRWLPPGVSTSVFGSALTEAHLDALDASAVDCIEVVGPVPQCPLDDPAFLARMAKRLRGARVRLHSVHLPYGRRLDLAQTDEAARGAAVAVTEQNIGLAAALGARLAILHPSAEPIADDVRPLRLDASRRSLESLSAVAAQHAVQLAMECLPRSCLGNTAAELLGLLDGVDPAVVGVCLDVNHLNLREPDIGAAVRHLGPRLLTLHCSDNDGIDERHWLPASNGGVVDWPAFVRALQAAGYAGPFLYEVRPLAGDAGDTLRQIEGNYARQILPLH